MSLIYCVEDDASIAELLKCALASGGHNTICSSSATDFYNQLNIATPSLILLDIMLPDKSGMEILTDLKSNNIFKEIPIIMLTAKSSEIDKVQGLEAGADDYITKPFGIMELLSRVKAVLRRATPALKEILYYKELSLNTQTREVIISENPIILTLKEYEILKYFLQNIGIALSRDKIIEHIWGYDFTGESRTIDMHIKSLRAKLAEYSCTINIITIRGIGYKLEKLV